MKCIRLSERSVTTMFAATLLVLAAGSWDCHGRGRSAHEGRDSTQGGINGMDRNNNHGRRLDDPDIMYESGSVKGKEIRLPDGTVVVMNAGTVISISSLFNKDNRDVELGGEALFTVAANAGKPFIVHTKDLKILVLGTRFRVDAYPGKAGEEVDLLSGSLKVMKSYLSDTDNEPELLQASEMVMINREIDLMEKEHFDPSEEKGWGIGPIPKN
jgi:ferric-dicitrate binding protein FerR (iron transport regulator)